MALTTEPVVPGKRIFRARFARVNASGIGAVEPATVEPVDDTFAEDGGADSAAVLRHAGAPTGRATVRRVMRSARS